MASRFLLQIVDRESNEVVQFEPGQLAELQFVEDCVQRILAKGVGFGRTQAHVEADIRAGLREAILTLKSLVRPFRP